MKPIDISKETAISLTTENHDKTMKLLMKDMLSIMGLPSPPHEPETEKIIQRCVHNCGRTREVEVPWPFKDFEGFAADEFDCGCNGSAWQPGQ